jgi:RNA polymerase sigma factor (sigma-70 family)
VTNSDTAEERFRTAFEQHSTRVFAYALRHTDPASAHDVVADVFLVAWRRIDDLPGDPLPWLLVVARNTIANRRRSATRQTRLIEHVTATIRMTSTPGAEDTAVERDGMLRALADLTEVEREAVLLVAWDGLDTADAAVVCGCSRNTFEVRLHRARARLERSLAVGPRPRRNPRLSVAQEASA